MPKSGAPTKEKILNTAESLVLDYGFAGTSVDKVIAKAGITKGTFFYHFKTKADLAKALIERFHKKEQATFDQFMNRAEKLSRDPLQQFLIFIGLFEELLDQMDEPYPGCLFASYLYQSQAFDEETICFCTDVMLGWRKFCGDKIRQIIETRQPRRPVTADSLADMFVCILEGTLLLSKALGDAKLAGPQLEHYRQYIELLFED